MTEQEWLVTGGLGGYAPGTVPGLRTRREHAPPAVAGHPDELRHAGLIALGLTLTLPSRARVPLHAHEGASGAPDPAGHRYLATFSLFDGVRR